MIHYSHKQIIAIFSGLFLLFFSVLAWQIFSHTELNAVDGMFHIRLARLYWERGLFTDFPWMQFSISQEFWMDHHLFFHLLLIPFTWIDPDLVRGQQWAGAFFGALALLACSVYLYLHQVRYFWLYSLLLLVASDVFLFRMMMPRAMSLSLIWLVLILWSLERQHHLLLLFASFFYLWTYQTAIVIVPMACVSLLWERYHHQRWEWRPLLYATAGLLLGMTLHPFFPNTFQFFFFILEYLFPFSAVTVPTDLQHTAMEWHPMPVWELVRRAYPALVMGLIIPLWRWIRRKPWPNDIGVLWVGTWVLFLATVLRANRFLEYAVPFAVLLGARLLEFPIFLPANSYRERWLRCVMVLLIISFLTVGIFYHRDLYRYAFDIHPHLFRGASRWLQQHTPARSVVFHPDWVSFTYLFFQNTHNHYIVGLDNHYLANWNPSLYRLYRLIALGRSPDPVRWIQHFFRSRYVVVAAIKSNQSLVAQLQLHPKARCVYEDPMVRVYELTATPPSSRPAVRRNRSDDHRSKTPESAAREKP